MDEKLINAIKSGNVEDSINAFVEFICGGEEQAHTMVTLVDSGLLLFYPEAAQMVGALVLKLSDLALKYEEENKRDS